MPTAPGSDHAAACRSLNGEYLRFGCPYVSTHPTYQHPSCVAMRMRMRASHCSVPGARGMNGLAGASPAGVLFGLAAAVLGVIVVAKLTHKERGHLKGRR